MALTITPEHFAAVVDGQDAYKQDRTVRNVLIARAQSEFSLCHCDAEDVVSASILSALGKLDERGHVAGYVHHSNSSLVGWLWRIVECKSLSRLRENRRRARGDRE